MLVTHSQETCTRILYKLTCAGNLHICRGFLYKFFLVQVCCTEYSAQETCVHMTKTEV